MHQLNCTVCGKSFRHRHPMTKTCSPECFRRKDQNRWNEYRRTHPEYQSRNSARQLRYWHTNPKYRARQTAYMRDYMRRRRAAQRAAALSGE